MVVEIKICMGSSCFARGNDRNLEIIEKYIKENNLNAKIELTGSRCENKCAIGPNIYINEKCYNNVQSKDILKLLEGIKNNE